MTTPSPPTLDHPLYEENRVNGFSTRENGGEVDSVLRELVVLSLDGVAIWQMD